MKIRSKKAIAIFSTYIYVFLCMLLAILGMFAVRLLVASGNFEVDVADDWMNKEVKIARAIISPGCFAYSPKPGYLAVLERGNFEDINWAEAYTIDTEYCDINVKTSILDIGSLAPYFNTDSKNIELESVHTEAYLARIVTTDGIKNAVVWIDIK